MPECTAKGVIAQPSNLSTATTSSEFKMCIQPIMDGHAPTTVNIEWGSIVLFHISQVYSTTNPGMHCKRCGLQWAQPQRHPNSTNASSPLWMANAPTMDNIQWRSIVLFHISPWMSPFITQQMPECTVSVIAQPQRHPNSKSASSPLWMAMHQQWLIIGGSDSIIYNEPENWAPSQRQL